MLNHDSDARRKLVRALGGKTRALLEAHEGLPFNEPVYTKNLL